MISCLITPRHSTGVITATILPIARGVITGPILTGTLRVQAGECRDGWAIAIPTGYTLSVQSGDDVVRDLWAFVQSALVESSLGGGGVSWVQSLPVARPGWYRQGESIPALQDEGGWGEPGVIRWRWASIPVWLLPPLAGLSAFS